MKKMVNIATSWTCIKIKITWIETIIAAEFTGILRAILPLLIAKNIAEIYRWGAERDITTKARSTAVNTEVSILKKVSTSNGMMMTNIINTLVEIKRMKIVRQVMNLDNIYAAVTTYGDGFLIVRLAETRFRAITTARMKEEITHV
jgi:hypothetical protein